MQFRTAIDLFGIMTMDKHIIMLRFMENGFVSELIAAIPIYLITLGLSSSKIIVAIVRLHRLALFFKLSTYLNMLEMKFQNSGRALTFTKLSMYLLIVWNFILCFWFYFLKTVSKLDSRKDRLKEKRDSFITPT